MYKEKICLLLEDDPDDQEFFMMTLHNLSDSSLCFAVPNGHKALEVLNAGQIRPDIIFTDLNMPSMDGLEFIYKVKQHYQFKDIPVIMYSNDYNEIQIERARKAGASAFYPKSTLSDLRKMLGKYFNQHHNHQSIL